MKKVVLSSLLVLAGSAYAEDNCEAWAAMAEITMQARQEGVSAQKLIGIAKDNKPLARIVKQSFDEPGYLTASHKMRAVNEFKSRVYLDCVDNPRSYIK